MSAYTLLLCICQLFFFKWCAVIPILTIKTHVVICRSEPVLPLLTFVQRSGNTTFYEWRTGTVPTVVERPIAEDACPETLTEGMVSFTVAILSSHHAHITKIQSIKHGLIHGYQSDFADISAM